MKKTLYITQETQDRLAKLGGPTPSENLRRAVALAECADELAKALEYHETKVGCGNSIDFMEHIKAKTMGREAINNYRSAKQ